MSAVKQETEDQSEDKRFVGSNRLETGFDGRSS